MVKPLLAVSHKLIGMLTTAPTGCLSLLQCPCQAAASFTTLAVSRACPPSCLPHVRPFCLSVCWVAWQGCGMAQQKTTNDSAIQQHEATTASSLLYCRASGLQSAADGLWPQLLQVFTSFFYSRTLLHKRNWSLFSYKAPFEEGKLPPFR